NTGRSPSGVVRWPAMGSVASHRLTPKELALPGFIGVGGTAQSIGPSFLGMAYAPFTVQNPGQPPANIKAPSTLGDPRTAEERLRRRQRLFWTLEDDFNAGAFPHLKSPKSKDKDPEKRKEGEAEEVAMRETAGSAAQAHASIYKK